MKSQKDYIFMLVLKAFFTIGHGLIFRFLLTLLSHKIFFRVIVVIALPKQPKYLFPTRSLSAKTKDFVLLCKKYIQFINEVHLHKFPF